MVIDVIVQIHGGRLFRWCSYGIYDTFTLSSVCLPCMIVLLLVVKIPNSHSMLLLTILSSITLYRPSYHHPSFRPWAIYTESQQILHSINQLPHPPRHRLRTDSLLLPLRTRRTRRPRSRPTSRRRVPTLCFRSSNRLPDR